MMDRNREARRAAAMVNGLPRRRHRTTSTTGGGSLRDSPEDEGPPPELQDTAARLRDRAVKKDRENRDRDQERERTSRSKRRRGDKFSVREEGSGGIDDSSEESVNDEDEEDDDVGGGPVQYAPSLTSVPMTSSSRASSLTHRKSYPLPTKVFRQPVAPTWKAPDEMIGVSIPRKARSSSTKRGHDWISGGGEQFLRQPSSSPVRSTMTAAAAASPSPAPVSPSSSNISIKKRIVKQKPPKSCLKSSSPPIQDDIEIEVAEVLYGLKRQTHAPSMMHESTAVSQDSSAKFDSKSRVSSPISAPPHNSTAPLTTVAPKRKRPRPYLDENQNQAGFGSRSRPISPNPDQALKLEAPSPCTEKNLMGSALGNGDLANSHDATSDSVPYGLVSDSTKLPVFENGTKSLRPPAMDDSGVVRATKVEEASSSPKMESTTSTSFKLNPSVAEKENHRGEKFEIDLMAPPLPSRGSPERGWVVGEQGGRRVTMMMGDEKPMVTNGQAEVRPNREEDERRLRLNVLSSAEPEAVVDVAVAKSKSKSKALAVPEAQSECGSRVQKPPSQSTDHHHHHRQFDLQFGFEKAKANPSSSTLAVDHHHKLDLRPQLKDEPDVDRTVGQSGSVPLPMAGWHAGLGPMGYVAAPLQGVVPMDASPPIQAAPPFVFTQPKSKRCATHWYIARSVSMHQQAVKMNPYWPAAATPLFGGAKPYNLNMVPPPGAAQDKAQPFALFPAQPAAKDKSPLPSISTSDPNNAHKKQQQQQQQQFLLPQSLPPGAPANMMHAPAFFFPFGQQQAVAAAPRPSSTKSPSTTGSGSGGASAATTSAAATSSAPMGAGPAMSFSYPNMAGGNETQFMAILGNNPYPFPVPAHVGVAPPYRGTHPHPHPQAAMSFFNGSFYSSQMLHPSQLQQSGAPPQAMQIQQIQQNHQNPSISTASSSSQKHQQRSQGGGGGASNPSWQNFQPPKGRPSQPHYDMGGAGGEDSPSTADSRTRPSMSVYGQNFAMPFHSAKFAMMTHPPPSASSSLGNNPNSNNNNHGDKKQQVLKGGIETLSPAFPMSFGSMNGATATQGLDISSMASSHAILQSLPEAARHNYQMMAAAAQAAQAAHNNKKNNYQDGKAGSNADSSNAEEERKAMAASRIPAASGGQSIAFSRDLVETSNVPGGGSVVDSSARSLNLIPGSSRHPNRSSAPNAVVSNSNNSNTSSNTQQQQSQMILSKQQQFVAATVAAARSKTPTTSNGNVYPDHISFPNVLPSYPPLVQGGGGSSSQWKNSGRPHTSQGSSSPSLQPSTNNSSPAPTNKNHHHQQQGRSQQNHTQISFASATTNPKQQAPNNNNNNQGPSSPMMGGSPSTSSISKGAGGGSPRTNTSASTGNKTGSNQGRNSPSPSLPTQKPSILGSGPHMTAQPPHESQQPQLSKQNIQQAQMFFSNPYMQASPNSSAGNAYYLQRHRPENPHGQKTQVASGAPASSSSGMLSLGGTSDPAKAASNNMKGMAAQGIFHGAQFSQSAGGTHQMVPAGFPYGAVPVKPPEQKQPPGE